MQQVSGRYLSISSQHEPDLIAQLLPLAHTKYLSMYPNCQGDMGHNLVVPQNIDLLPGNAADCSLQEQARSCRTKISKYRWRSIDR